MPVRQLPSQDIRVETGPVQFGQDWPGIFIRGDHALWLSMQLKVFLTHPDYPLREAVAELAELLASCRATDQSELAPDKS